MAEKKGLVWVIPDGDLPPPGKGKIKGHESLIIINPGKKNAEITYPNAMTILVVIYLATLVKMSLYMSWPTLFPLC